MLIPDLSRRRAVRCRAAGRHNSVGASPGAAAAAGGRGGLAAARQRWQGEQAAGQRERARKEQLVNNPNFRAKARPEVVARGGTAPQPARTGAAPGGNPGAVGVAPLVAGNRQVAPLIAPNLRPRFRPLTTLRRYAKLLKGNRNANR